MFGKSCVAIGGSEHCGLTNAAARLVCPSLLVFWGLLKLSWTSRRIKAINNSCRICLLNAFDKFFMSPCWTVKSIHQPGLSEACRVPNGTHNGQWFLIFFFCILHFATGWLCYTEEKGLIICTSSKKLHRIRFCLQVLVHDKTTSSQSKRQLQQNIAVTDGFDLHTTSINISMIK